MKRCLTCASALTGNQRKFCSLLCKNRNNNNIFQNYRKQQERAFERKLLLVNEAGGCCVRCNYSKNLAALCFHHLDSNVKEFSLTSRELSNNNLAKLRSEAAKCQLLCSNCHMEVHHPAYHLEPTPSSRTL